MLCVQLGFHSWHAWVINLEWLYIELLVAWPINRFDVAHTNTYLRFAITWKCREKNVGETITKGVITVMKMTVLFCKPRDLKCRGVKLCFCSFSQTHLNVRPSCHGPRLSVSHAKLLKNYQRVLLLENLSWLFQSSFSPIPTTKWQQSESRHIKTHTHPSRFHALFSGFIVIAGLSPCSH